MQPVLPLALSLVLGAGTVPITFSYRGIEGSFARAEITALADDIIEVDWWLETVTDTGQRFETTVVWRNAAAPSWKLEPIVHGGKYISTQGVAGTKGNARLLKVWFRDGSAWTPDGMAPALAKTPTVRVKHARPFTIDQTLVTEAQYRQWLATSPSPAGQPAACSGNRDFAIAPACQGYDFGCPSVSCPVRCVDWCDARAYCLAKGRRLCGKPGGGAADFQRFQEVEASQWTAACVARAFDTRQYTPVWEDSCEGDYCRTRSFVIGMPGDPTSQAILCIPGNTWLRLEPSAVTGIRCCD